MFNFKKKSISFSLIFTMVALVYILTGLNLNAGNEKPYVNVLLKNRSILQFDYDSFSLNCRLPMTIKDNLTCETKEIDRDRLAEIYFFKEVYDTCDEKNKWVLEVYFADESSVRGFLVVDKHFVQGKLMKSGEEKSIPFKDIKRIYFAR